MERKKVQTAIEICKKVKTMKEQDLEDDSDADRTNGHNGSRSTAVPPSVALISDTQPSNIMESQRRLDRAFSRVQTQLMKVRSVSVEDLRCCVATLPSFKSQSPTSLLNASTKEEFFHRLKDYCNAQDPEILEDIIEELGDKETKQIFYAFNQDRKEFQRKTKLKDLTGYSGGHETTPPQYKELEIKLGDSWGEKTIEDLKQLKRQLSTNTWLLKMVDDGSIVVTFVVPNSEKLELTKKQRQNLRSQNVLQITMGGKWIFKSKGK